MEMVITIDKWLCREQVYCYFCSMKRIATIMAASLAACAACAQRHIVVADMDTRLPLPGVVIATDNGQRATTDYLGSAHTALPFRSATVSKKHYMQRRVSYDEAQRDTVFLIPQEVVLDDVVVTAPGMALDMRKSMNSISENAKLNNMAKNGFNLLGLLQLLAPSKKSKAQSRAESIKKILEKY